MHAQTANLAQGNEVEDQKMTDLAIAPAGHYRLTSTLLGSAPREGPCRLLGLLSPAATCFVLGVSVPFALALCFGFMSMRLPRVPDPETSEGIVLVPRLLKATVSEDIGLLRCLFIAPVRVRQVLHESLHF